MEGFGLGWTVGPARQSAFFVLALVSAIADVLALIKTEPEMVVPEQVAPVEE